MISFIFFNNFLYKFLCVHRVLKILEADKSTLKMAYEEAYKEHDLSSRITVNADFLNNYSDNEADKKISSDRIIRQAANSKGELGVMIQKKKSLVNHKRIKLKTPAPELYPPDYDFSVIFDTVKNRKARHKLDKGHHPDVVVHVEEELK